MTHDGGVAPRVGHRRQVDVKALKNPPPTPGLNSSLKTHLKSKNST